VGGGDELPFGSAGGQSAALEAVDAPEEFGVGEDLRWRADWEAEHGRRLGGRRPAPPDPGALTKRTVNTTDPDTRLIYGTGSTAVQGYNAQAVTQQSNDSGQLEPMITSAAEALKSAGIEEPLDVVLADGGYWNSPQITRLRDRGIKPIVPTKARTCQRVLMTSTGTSRSSRDQAPLTRTRRAPLRLALQASPPQRPPRPHPRGSVFDRRYGVTFQAALTRVIMYASRATQQGLTPRYGQ
jgi:hypothetical protein